MPNETKWTPGPWVIAPFDELDKRVPIVTPGVEHAPLAWVDNDDVAPGEGQANAALIAAAPEMYEALRDLEEAHRQVVHGERTHIPPELWAKAQQILLAAADGKTP